MDRTEYNFERFIQPSFPLYASEQSGRDELVKIHDHAAAKLMQVPSG